MHPSLCVRTPNGLTDHIRQANVPHRHETLMLTRHTSQIASLSKPEQRMQQCQASGRPGEPSAQDQPTPSHQQAAATSSPSGGSWFSWQRAKEMQFQLQSMGLAGIVSYGILNTLYYTCTFVFVWLFVLHVPQGLGWGPATRKFFEVLGVVWGLSQVTKIPRAAGALALAPFVDRGLGLIVQRFSLPSKQQAFTVVVLGCLALTALVFFVIVAAWS